MRSKRPRGRSARARRRPRGAPARPMPSSRCRCQAALSREGAKRSSETTSAPSGAAAPSRSRCRCRSRAPAAPAATPRATQHGRDGARRRHGLAAGQRQGDVGAGEIGEAPRREDLARHELHGPQERDVAGCPRRAGTGRTTRSTTASLRPLQRGRGGTASSSTDRPRSSLEGLGEAGQGRLVGQVEAQGRHRDAPVRRCAQRSVPLPGAKGWRCEGDPEIRVAAPVDALVEPQQLLAARPWLMTRRPRPRPARSAGKLTLTRMPSVDARPRGSCARSRAVVLGAVPSAMSSRPSGADRPGDRAIDGMPRIVPSIAPATVPE